MRIGFYIFSMTRCKSIFSLQATATTCKKQLPVSHSLNQNRSRFLYGYLPRFHCGVVHGQSVVTIDSNGQHSVTGAAGSNAVSFILFMHRCRNGIAIIAAALKCIFWSYKNLVVSSQPLPQNEDMAKDHEVRQLYMVRTRSRLEE